MGGIKEPNILMFPKQMQDSNYVAIKNRPPGITTI